MQDEVWYYGVRLEVLPSFCALKPCRTTVIQMETCDGQAQRSIYHKFHPGETAAIQDRLAAAARIRLSITGLHSA